MFFILEKKTVPFFSNDVFLFLKINFFFQDFFFFQENTMYTFNRVIAGALANSYIILCE